MSRSTPYFDLGKFVLRDTRTGMVSDAYEGSIRVSEHNCTTHICWYVCAQVSMPPDALSRYDLAAIEVEVRYERGARIGHVLLTRVEDGYIAMALAGYQPITWMSNGYIARSIRAIKLAAVRIFG